jgi:hypothetical protein
VIYEVLPTSGLLSDYLTNNNVPDDLQLQVFGVSICSMIIGFKFIHSCFAYVFDLREKYMEE